MKGLIPKWIDLFVITLVMSVTAQTSWANDPEALHASQKERLVIIGMDGLTWNLLDPMMERGELPELQGARRPRTGYPFRIRTPYPLAGFVDHHCDR